MAEEDVKVSFGATITQLLEGVAKVKESIDSVKEHAASVTEGISGMAAALGTAFAGRELFEFINGMAELGEATRKTSDIFGISAGEVGLLNFAAKETGGTGEALVRSLERMSVSLQQAGAHATPTGVALKAMGLDAGELSKLALPELLDKMRDKFSQLEPGMQRTAVAQALVRGGAETMLPVLEMSNEKWDELRTTFNATGAAMSESMAGAFAETKEKITTFQTAIVGLGERIFNVVRPAIDAALSSMTGFLESMDGPHVSAALNSLVTTVESTMEKIVEIIASVMEAANGIIVRLKYVSEYGFAAGLTSNVKKMTAELDDMNAATEKQLEASKKMFQSWSDTIKNLMNGVKNASGSPDDRGTVPKSTGTAPVLDFTPPATADTKSENGDLAVLQSHAALTKQLLDDQLSEHGISMQQWAAQTRAAVDEEHNAQKAGLEKELALGGLKVAQRKAILDKLLVLEDHHAGQVETINKKLHDDSVSSWGSLLDPIASSLNSQISAVLKGTESIAQAFENMGLDLITTAIENAVKAIAASAAQAFAGTVANLSPAMGPAALGPAAGVQAAVMAVGGALQSFEVGTWGLPSDSPVMAHQGEMIAPAFESGKIRAMADAFDAGKLGVEGIGKLGGGDTHIHIHAVDAQSFVQRLKTHGDDLAKVVSARFNAQPSMRPSY